MTWISPDSPLAIGLKQYPMTLLLLAICIGLFAIQLLVGVDPSQPQAKDLLAWGANFLPLSLTHEPWRLVSSLFLHIGFLHLMFNSFALYYFGQVAERMLGSWQLLALFLLSGIGGNVLGLWLGWQKILDGQLPAISAGASGGVMGIGMALLVTAAYKKPIHGILLNLSSLITVMVINLSFGFLVSGIDNAGHIGGALTGACLGICFIAQYHTRKRTFGLITLFGYISLVMLMVMVYGYLHTIATAIIVK